MSFTWPVHYQYPYQTCGQCGWKCTPSCQNQSCFGDKCEYIERVSSNRFDGYPQKWVSWSGIEHGMNNPNYQPSHHQDNPHCRRVSPMIIQRKETCPQKLFTLPTIRTVHL